MLLDIHSSCITYNIFMVHILLQRCREDSRHKLLKVANVDHQASHKTFAQGTHITEKQSHVSLLSPTFPATSSKTACQPVAVTICLATELLHFTIGSCKFHSVSINNLALTLTHLNLGTCKNFLINSMR